MDFTEEKNGEVVIIKSLTSKATVADAHVFKNFMLMKINNGESKLIFDLSEIVLLDSTFLGAMVVVHRRLTSIGNKLVLCGINEAVGVLLGLTKLNESFAVFKTRNEAVASFPKKQNHFDGLS